jgi:hypothetical protein
LGVMSTSSRCALPAPLGSPSSACPVFWGEVVARGAYRVTGQFAGEPLLFDTPGLPGKRSKPTRHESGPAAPVWDSRSPNGKSCQVDRLVGVARVDCGCTTEPAKPSAMAEQDGHTLFSRAEHEVIVRPSPRRWRFEQWLLTWVYVMLGASAAL